MQKLVMLLFSSLILGGCNQPKWQNKVDPLALDCGLARDADLHEKSLVRFAKAPSMDANDLAIYRVESNPDQVENISFELTSKGCLLLWNKDLGEKTDHVSVVAKNSQALDLTPEDLAKALIPSEFQSCGGNCAVFPLCGALRLANGDLAFKINSAPGTKLNAMLEYEFVSTPLEVNARHCFALPLNSRGTLKLQDDLGNFLEAQPENLLRAGGGQSVSALSLRGPLTPAEKQCKADAKHLRMENDSCIPKTFEFYCEENPGLEGVAIVSSDFVRKDCSYIGQWLKKQTRLDYLNRKMSDAQVLSGLENIKALDLRSNRLATLGNLYGTHEVEELNLSMNEIPFDIASLQRFPHLKHLDIRVVRLKNLEHLPVMPEVESLAASDFNPTLLAKFPNLKTLNLIEGEDVSLLDLPSFPRLENLELWNFNNLRDLASLSRYKELRSLRLYNINGIDKQDMPVLSALEVLNIYRTPPPRFSQLEKAEKLETLIFDMTFGLPESIPPLRFLKRVEIDGSGEFELGWLAGSQDLKEIKFLGGPSTIASLPFLPSLQSLDASLGSLTTIAGLDKAPNLVTLYLNSGSELFIQDLVNLPEFPQLQTFVCTCAESDQQSATGIAWLKKMPKLRFLNLNLNAQEEVPTTLLPKGLEVLNLQFPISGSLDFLRDLNQLTFLNLDLTGQDLQDASTLRIGTIDEVQLNVPVEQIEQLPVFTNIMKLRITLSREGDDLTGLNRLPEKLLYAQSISLTHLLGKEKNTWLQKIKGLKRLDFNDYRYDLSTLPALPNLTYLRLSNSWITDLTGIEAFTELEEIEFSSAKLKSLANLQSNRKLKVISGLEKMRGNFWVEETCPDTENAPEGLRIYCQNLLAPSIAFFGPMPF